jgi:hypothetical protein
MRIELDLNEVEVELIIEALNDKGKENNVTSLFCGGVVRHIKEKAKESGMTLISK